MNPIAALLIITTFGLSLTISLRRGFGATFAYVLLPSVLLLYTVEPIEIQKLPDVTMVGAVSYGALLALAITGFKLPIRFGVIDAAVLALSLWRISSGVANGSLWTGVSTVGSETLNVLVPYLLARAAFVDPFWRLRAAQVIAGIAICMTPILMIETRLTPLFYNRYVLDPLGLTSVNWTLVQGRFGLFRAQGAFCHPIDLGNGAVVMVAMLIALGGSAGARLSDKWFALGIAGGVFMSLASMSFTSFIALGAVAGLFIVMRVSRFYSFLLVPIGLLGLAGYSAATYHFVTNEPVEPTWNYDETADETSGSLYTRHLIVYSTFDGPRGAPHAGLLGYGEDGFDPKTFGLLSIDNSYIVFVLENGWGYLTLFILMALVLGLRSTGALLKLRDGTSRAPMAAGAAGVIGTMLGMYTVFFGFVYATLFWLLIGIVASMLREVDERTGRSKPTVQLDAGRKASIDKTGRGAFA